MKIPFHRPYMTKEEISGAADAVRSGWLTAGPKTLEFEKKFRDCIFGHGGGHAVAVSSATAALHLALKAVGIKAGDEVILPTNTFVATAEAVTYLGAVPVLCDMEEDTHNIDVSRVERLVTGRTRAVVPVHFGGQPCDMDEILDIARRHKLHVVEDAAHAFPASYKGKMVGTLSEITCFSFYVTKTLCTGEGGMAVTCNDEYSRNMRISRLHGIDADAWGREGDEGGWRYDVVDSGFKYNMNDIAASLGIAQLAKAESMLKARKRIAERYDAAFSGTRVVPVAIRPDRKSSFHLYAVKVNNRDELMQKLKDKGIGTSVHFIPVHRFSYYRKTYGYRDDDYPVAESVYKKVLSLPIYPGLGDGEVDYVAETVLDHAR